MPLLHKIDKPYLTFYYGGVKLKPRCLSICMLLISLMGLTVPLSLFAQPDIKTLENGLTILLHPIEGAENVAVVLAYHAGADAQTASTAGLFKFLEYALFNGPAMRPGVSEPASAIDVLEPDGVEGGSGIDRFEFGFSVKKENIVPALDTLRYLFSQERRDFVFAQADGIEYARQSVRALIQNGLSDNDIVSNIAIIKKLFSKEPYRMDTLGADYVIEKSDAATLRSLASSWLVPNNACIAIAGGFDREETIEFIAQRFGTLPKAPNPWPTGLSVFPKPGVTRPTFLVFPDSSLPSGQMQIEIRYRGPDPKDTQSYVAALMLQELANAPSSRFQTAVRKGMPKGTDIQDLRIVYAPTRNSSWLAVESTIGVPSGKNPADLAFSFKELVRGTELYMVRANASYFTSAEYQRAREALLEKKMAEEGDPLQSAARMARLWSWGIAPFLLQESDAIMKTGQKNISQLADTYVQKNLEVVMVRIDPTLYEAYKKSFSNYGFETVSSQNAFWWR
jgi:zinc protease